MTKSQKKIRNPNAFKKSQICGFWLKKSQYRNPADVYHVIDAT